MRISGDDNLLNHLRRYACKTAIAEMGHTQPPAISPLSARLYGQFRSNKRLPPHLETSERQLFASTSPDEATIPRAFLAEILHCRGLAVLFSNGLNGLLTARIVVTSSAPPLKKDANTAGYVARLRQFYAVNLIVRICLRYVYMTPDNGGVRVSWAGRLFGCLRAKTCERKALRKQSRMLANTMNQSLNTAAKTARPKCI
jgi:hypothetical protein